MPRSFKISPEELNPKQPETELNLSLQRNEKLAKHAQRQLEEDGRLPQPHGDPEQPRRKSKRKSSLKHGPHKEHTEHQKGSHKEIKPNEEMKGRKSKNDLDTKKVKSTDDVSTTRIDVVVFVVVLADIIGCLAVGYEIYAYSIDQEWNSIVQGESPIRDVNGHHIFEQKTFQLKDHETLTKTLEYSIRDEPQEIVFMVLILLFVLISLIHICSCYIKTKDVERYTVYLITIYAVGGAICIFSSTFLVSAAIDIENRFTYAADMLHNFRFISTDEPVGPNDQDKCNKEYKNGCDYYEFAKVQALYLERIFRQCGSGSRFTRYIGIDFSKTTVEVLNVTYTRSDLKELGFCSRDGFKFVAAMLAILMGILFAIVPVIFCCQGKATAKRGDREHLANEESAVGPLLKSEQSEGEPKPRQTTAKTEEEEPQKTVTEPPEAKSDVSSHDATAYVEQFRAYVEKDSEEDAPKVSTTEDPEKVVGTKPTEDPEKVVGTKPTEDPEKVAGMKPASA